MDTRVQIFSNPALGEIRTARTEAGDPLFCLADVCKILDLDQVSRVKARLNTDGVTTNTVIDSLGRSQEATFITEPNLYKVIFQSRKPEAEDFTDWVTKDVLPSIRKNGGYLATTPEDTPETLMAKALLVADQTIKKQQAQLKDQAPKVLFAESVMASGQSVLIEELAKILTQKGYEIGRNRMFDYLRKNGFLCTKGESYNQPTQKYVEMGLFEIKKQTINQPGGTVLISTTTKVTPKGQIYFTNKFLKDLQP